MLEVNGGDLLQSRLAFLGERHQHAPFVLGVDTPPQQSEFRQPVDKLDGGVMLGE
jgi:hypothetical protein